MARRPAIIRVHLKGQATAKYQRGLRHLPACRLLRSRYMSCLLNLTCAVPISGLVLRHAAGHSHRLPLMYGKQERLRLGL